MQLGIMRR